MKLIYWILGFAVERMGCARGFCGGLEDGFWALGFCFGVGMNAGAFFQFGIGVEAWKICVSCGDEGSENRYA